MVDLGVDGLDPVFTERFVRLPSTQSNLLHKIVDPPVVLTPNSKRLNHSEKKLKQV